jgi:hypothetical protein
VACGYRPCFRPTCRQKAFWCSVAGLGWSTCACVSCYRKVGLLLALTIRPVSLLEKLVLFLARVCGGGVHLFGGALLCCCCRRWCDLRMSCAPPLPVRLLHVLPFGSWLCLLHFISMWLWKMFTGGAGRRPWLFRSGMNLCSAEGDLCLRRGVLVVCLHCAL